MTTFIAGFTLSFSLIMAIGAQNAFILKQAITKQHLFLICCICAVSDAILITLGVLGFGVVVTEFPWVETLARFGGALFLTMYGFWNFRSAFNQVHALTASHHVEHSQRRVLLTCLAFTWLNPHVYLDTVVLLGSISTQYANPFIFAFGAMTASFVFFFSLGYAAKRLSPFLEKPRVWQIFEGFIGCFMWGIALSLIW